MAYWVEVHCNITSEGPANWSETHLDPFCATNRNDNPASGGPNAQRAARFAEAEARRRGWVKRGTEWICPNCRRELNDQALARSVAAAVQNGAKSKKLA